MFKNLRTSTKLFLLCSMFLVAIAVTTYGLVAEKLIAINFTQKELAGTRYFTTLRSIYAAILTGRGLGTSGANAGLSPDSLLASLAAAQSEAESFMETSDLERSLAKTVSELWSGKVDAPNINELVPKALTEARNLASRIADDSNLALDPDLDTYYVQNIVMNRLPLLLGQLGEVQALLEPGVQGAVSDGREVHLLILEGLIKSTLDGIRSDIISAYRGNADGVLKRTVDASIAALISSASAYLTDARKSIVPGAPLPIGERALGQRYSNAIDQAISAWTTTQTELDRLLQERIDELSLRLLGSLVLTGILAGLSILIAVMTHRHITQPLQRLEAVARKVRKTRNYGLRIKYAADDEIGGLAAAFNSMMTELADARERETAEQARIATLQSDLARASRLTTMGEIAATIAHEINQPLSAIVTNGSAGLRWLANPTPNLDEANAALKRIVKDGHRASGVITSIRAMLKRTPRDKTLVNVNEVIRDVLVLSHDELQSREIAIETALSDDLPAIMADRVQIQQVIVNLIMNAADAMGSVTDRARILRVNSAKNDPASVIVVVEDSGPGIEEADIERIFAPFYTTKSEGMGLGLSICRSIIEEHGGHLSADRGEPNGSVFRIVLPAYEPGAE
jgi:signal transduction histidine kinase